MSTNAVCLQKDQEELLHAIQGALEKLPAAGGEVILDFSSVQRIDGAALAALEKLAGAAESQAAKVALRGVCIQVYKVLKAMKLSARFSVLT